MPAPAYLRIALGLSGTCLLATGLLATLPWLCGAGLVALVLAEVSGQAVAGVPAATPAQRLSQAVGEALPGVAVGLFMPAAMLVPAALGLRPLVCGAIETVLLSRGRSPGAGRGLTRRALTAGANLALVAAAAHELDLVAIPVRVAQWFVPGSVAAACLVSAGSIFRGWLAMRGR